MANRDWVHTFLVLNTVATPVVFVLALLHATMWRISYSSIGWVLFPLLASVLVWMTLAWWMYAKSKDRSIPDEPAE